MAKSSKRRQTNTGTTAKKQLKRILAHANAQSNPLATLPSAFRTVNIAPRKNSAGETNNNDDAPTTKSATIHYYKSPLPESLLKQCLDLFQANMGDMYRKSEWGLDMEEKKKELLHEDARFLIIMLNDAHDGEGCGVNDTHDNADNDNAATNPNNPQQKVVIGFAHFRYEPDEDSPHNPLSPITYLYELQISHSFTSHGLGRTLMTLVELLSMQLSMTKVILTVFKCNMGAMRFYLNKLKGYDVDECSPSNFEGEEDIVDYEILSKRIMSGNKS
eukprot:CAMPEP_0201734672 /NCGR_PEP_ID=MMETSP0593-20130828/34947_1 /ASSEMBLY_ACC=CAM_ASM_000672 /TAXON_ID=267983 /ORGANISM="Skeletonema japonicum, Strain CCMP2506" /LENGTH=273 /DNA_ID=CAMNT_0048228063 /DNA_START=13 /DNA_END=834 /DNA_ORIENTATION=-